MGNINEYPGGYDDWLIQRKTEYNKPEPEIKKRIEKPVKTKIKKSLSYKESRELEGITAKIQELEKEQSGIFKYLSDPELYEKNPDEVTGKNKRLEMLDVEIKNAYDKWEYLEKLKKSFEH
jgi:ABC transport system ATP-binding/permease protein